MTVCMGINMLRDNARYKPKCDPLETCLESRQYGLNKRILNSQFTPKNASPPATEGPATTSSPTLCSSVVLWFGVSFNFTSTLLTGTPKWLCLLDGIVPIL